MRMKTIVFLQKESIFDNLKSFSEEIGGMKSYARCLYALIFV